MSRVYGYNYTVQIWEMFMFLLRGMGNAYFFLLRPIDHSWATIVVGPNDKASFPIHLLIYAVARQDGSVFDKKNYRAYCRTRARLRDPTRPDPHGTAACVRPYNGLSMLSHWATIAD